MDSKICLNLAKGEDNQPICEVAGKAQFPGVLTYCPVCQEELVEVDSLAPDEREAIAAEVADAIIDEEGDTIIGDIGPTTPQEAYDMAKKWMDQFDQRTFDMETGEAGDAGEVDLSDMVWSIPTKGKDNDITSRDNQRKDWESWQKEREEKKRERSLAQQILDAQARDGGKGTRREVVQISNTPSAVGEKEQAKREAKVEESEGDMVWRLDEVKDLGCVNNCPIVTIPSALISESMWKDWMAMAEGSDLEWLAYLRTSPLPEDHPHFPGVVIEDMYIPDQVVSGGHVDVREGDLMAGGNAAVHSHVDMGVFWSGEDVAHRNWPLEIVVNRRGQWLANFLVTLDCGKKSRVEGKLLMMETAKPAGGILAKLQEQAKKHSSDEMKALKERGKKAREARLQAEELEEGVEVNG